MRRGYLTVVCLWQIGGGDLGLDFGLGGPRRRDSFYSQKGL